MQNTTKPGRLSREEFLTNLCDSGLFTYEQVGGLLDSLADGDALARHLMAAGKLTAYQAEAVRERRFSELRIGNYEVLDRLGAGGMGTVFKARHRRMKRVVALKVLSRTACQSDTFLPRFQREVEVISRLSHPNIVMAFDADEADAGHFLVMEFVNGRDLGSEVQARGPLPAGEAVAALLQAARALEYAHGQGIIHRDVKPANLLRDDRGVVKVADLGLARCNEAVAPGSQSGLTQAGGIVGTVDYMPPEQAFDSTSIDHRADVYSLGATLHFLLTGRPPFKGESLMAILLRHREAPIPSLVAARPDVPPPLDAVFRKMMAKKPEDRYQTMAEVARALEGLELAPAGAPPVPGPAADPAPQTASTVVPGSALTTEAVLPAGVDSGVTTDLTSLGKAPAAAPVLLVEPSRTQANIIRKFLQELGTDTVLVAPTGRKALEMMRAGRPRAVVAAMHLDDMTGAELLQAMRGEAALADVGFVLITSSQAGTPLETVRAAGTAHTALLAKPFDRDKLGQALTAVAAAPPAAVAGAFAGLRVLVVDDSLFARHRMREALAGLGVRHLTEAADGAEAAALVAREDFNLVVTDYEMPGMDGRELTVRIRQRSTVPVLLMTAVEDPAALEALRRAGVTDICGKNARPEVVRGIIERML
jgi:CheY-like chemotaxis protein